MSISKSIAYAAPYSSSTFNTKASYETGANGVVTGMQVSTSGSAVTVQPGIFLQNGIHVPVSNILSATLSGALTAPYFLAVTTTQLAVQLPNEVITPTFVKRPQDVSANTVLVAKWDGQEWHALPALQLNAVSEFAELQAAAQNLAGIASGGDVSISGGVLTLEPFNGYTTDGTFVDKTLPVSFTVYGNDTDGYDRVDEMLLRKPLDSPTRAEQIIYEVGPTFTPGTPNTFQTAIALAAGGVAVSAPLVLNIPYSNGHVFIYRQGVSGAAASLKLRTTPDALTAPTAAVTLASNLETFDAILNPDGNIDLVYTRATQIFYQRVDPTGAPIIAETALYTNANTVSTPKIVSILQEGSYFLHVVFQRMVNGSQNDLWYIRLNNTGTVETAALLFVTLSDLINNPSIDKDDDDSILYLAFENTDTTFAYLYSFDVGTTTALSVPAQASAPIELQTDVYNLDSESVLPVSGASFPVVKRTRFKETYVFWRQFKGSGLYGVAVYNRTYLASFGHKAILRGLYSAGENISSFRVAVDGLANAYFNLVTAGTAQKSALQLVSGDVLGIPGTVFGSSSPTDISICFNAKGALVHGYVDGTALQSYFRKSTAGPINNMRDYSIPFSDCFLTHYRCSDNAISVAGTALEEDITIRRLYEYNNCYGAGAAATWGVVSANVLNLLANLTLQFINRESTYTIDLGVFTIPNGSVMYVQIPDEDADATLTPVVVAFGDGILDRYHRNIFPLFWNIGGNLYLRFAPWMATEGSTIIIGQTVTQQERDWLGLPVNPDPTNHAYSSDNIVDQSDDYNEAIGKLDAAASASQVAGRQNRNTKLVYGGQWSWALETGLLTFTADAYLDIPGLADSRNTIPFSTQSPITLSADGQVAYVECNRTTGATADLAVIVDAVDSVIPDDNTIIIARRIGGRIVVGDSLILRDTDILGLTENFDILASSRIDVVSVATIAALTTATSYIQITGSTATTIQGALAGSNGQYLSILNATTVPLTISNQNAGAAAANRFLLPGANDITVSPDSSAEFIYDLSAARWRVKSGSGGGGVSPTFLQEVIGTGDDVTTTFTLPGIPQTNGSALLELDGIGVDISDRTILTNQVTFGTAPALGQEVAVFMIEQGLSGVTGQQQIMTGTVDGVNDTFGVAGLPADKSSSFVMIDGVWVEPAGWDLVQGVSSAQVVFQSGYIPSAPQEPSIFYIEAIGTIGGGGGGGTVTGAANEGAGVGLFDTLSAGTLNFKSLIEGSNVTITDNHDGTVTLTATGGGGSGIVTSGDFASPTVIDPTVGIVPANTDDQAMWVTPTTATSGPIPITSENQIAAGTTVGQRLTLFGVTNGSGGYFTVANGSGVYSPSGDFQLPSGQCLVYMWNGANWQFVSNAI